jgi:PIN domain nuclease of toxin-antitoxin system
VQQVAESANTLQLIFRDHFDRDPSDRMLVCQALTHGMTILTPDELVRQYPARVFW